MNWLNLNSLLGLFALGALAWAVGGFRRPVPWRTVVGSGLLLLAIGVIVFRVPQTRAILVQINRAVIAVLDGSTRGTLFLFGPLALGPGGTTPAGEPSIGIVVAAQVLPAVVFFAALMALLFHIGLVQPVVRWFGKLFHRTLGLSGAEALAGATNVFFGVEAATTVRPYLGRMTRSELLTVLTCGMSTVASTTLAVYVLYLRDSFPQIAGHLISASVLSIPAAALCSKLILPETDRPLTLGAVPALEQSARHSNFMGALAAGAWDGLRLAAGIAALLIAVLGLVGVIDLALTQLGGPFGGTVDLERLLGWLFMPLTALLGIEPADLIESGRILGARLVLTEFVAYERLSVLAAQHAVSARTLLILSYALCGFAHIASVGIFVGGLSALAPERRDDLAGLGLQALAGATLATLMTGALAGLFYHGQTAVLGL